ncbi:MAG: RNA polymerase factor sigma-54 [Spirochaetaceae bacterium]|nr:RNA polymerase factor sigma-54 [Spirochaetaceae bacterium]
MQVQRQSFVQEQRLRMNPQLFQSIQLMELPVVDLRAKIAEELERNPALEVAADRSTVSLDEGYGSPKEEYDYFEASSDAGFIRSGGAEAADGHRRFIEQALARDETLQERLLWNLRLVPVDDAIRRMGELIIQNLNEDGFHKEPPELLLRNEDPRLVEAALMTVRALDPPGCATKDYRESLLVQARLLNGAPGGMEEALLYLELLEKGKFDEASKKLGKTADETREIYRRIREDLSPFPGRQYTPGEVRYVTPDVQVFTRGGNFIIKINDEEIPVLRINSFFRKMSGSRPGRRPRAVGERESKERQARDYVNANVRDARLFIHSIRQRERTLKRVSRAVVEFQRSFFANGPKYLAPLTLRDIAEELGIHETTVSRTASGKYMQTEWGIFEIRHFFSNSISGAGSGGSRHSKSGVKERIRELISGEDRRCSDQEIADLLAAQGITIARRTVAKYRNELDLGSSYTR